MDGFELTQDELMFLTAIRLTENRQSQSKPKTARIGQINFQRLTDGDRKELISGALANSEFRFELIDAIVSREFEQSEVRKTNLPSRLRTYIPFGSRAAQLAAIGSNQKARLISIVGSSGTGKTRLAQKIGEDFLASYADGVWFVDCKTFSTLETFTHGVMRQVSSDPHIWQNTNLHEYFESSQLLIILDDVQPVPSVIEELSRINSKCLKVKIFTTCHAPLNINGELVYEIEKSALPNIEDAVHFFNQMAKYLFGDNSVSYSTNVSLRSLCKRFSCVPMAFSLAAGCLAGASPAQILSTLDSKGPTHSLISSQGNISQTIQCLLQLSVSQMTIDERKALVGLSLFSGDTRVSQASAVLSDVPDINKVLNQLEKRGFLEIDSSGIEPFCRLHHSVTDYLSGMTADAEAQSQLLSYQTGYVNYFESKASEIQSLLEYGDWSQGTSALYSNLGNLRNAIRLAQFQENVIALKTFCHSLARPLMESSLVTDFEQLVQTASLNPELRDDPKVQILLLGLQGANFAFKSRLDQCEELWNERLELCRASGDEFNEADTLTDLAYLAVQNGEYSKAFAVLDEATAATSRAGSIELLTTTNVIRARCHQLVGNTEETKNWLTISEQNLHSCSKKELMLFVYQMIAICYDELGVPDQGRQQIVNLLRDASSGHRSVLTGWSLGILAKQYEDQSQLELAAKGYVAAVAVFQRYSSKHLSAASKRLSTFRENHPELSGIIGDLELVSWSTHVGDILAHEHNTSG